MHASCRTGSHPPLPHRPEMMDLSQRSRQVLERYHKPLFPLRLIASRCPPLSVTMLRSGYRYAHAEEASVKLGAGSGSALRAAARKRGLGGAWTRARAGYPQAAGNTGRRGAERAKPGRFPRPSEERGWRFTGAPAATPRTSVSVAVTETRLHHLQSKASTRRWVCAS